MTRNPAHFPNCKADHDAFKQSVPADIRRIQFTGVPAGRYALSVFHDENANQKLDTLVGVGSKSRLACQASITGTEPVTVELLGALSG